MHRAIALQVLRFLAFLELRNPLKEKQMKTFDKGIMALVIHKGIAPGHYKDSVGCQL